MACELDLTGGDGRKGSAGEGQCRVESWKAEGLRGKGGETPVFREGSKVV